MSEMKMNSKPEQRRVSPAVGPVQWLYRFMASAKLAIFLLVIILGCCLVGATAFSYDRAAELIFYSLWFNGLLVLLVANVAFCFFGRIWGKKVTVISFGMILFHLSFVGLFLGVVYNSLFCFRGEMRITEGETLANDQRLSYDAGEKGKFFNLTWLKGETTLNKVHSQYKVDGSNKRYAYELTVGSPKSKTHAIIYATKNLTHYGTGYYCDREGYSVLVVLSDKQGRELYGAHIPLQSLKERKEDENFYYTTGTKTERGSLPYPQGDEKPLFNLQLQYLPDLNKERSGEVYFKIWPFTDDAAKKSSQPLAEGRAPIGGSFQVGEYRLSPQEIRYWVGLNVKFEPGQPIVLTCLWFGLGGLIITFVGRIQRSRSVAIRNNNMGEERGKQ